MAEVVVGATLFDLIGLSLALNMPVSSLFLNYCRFGFQSNEFNPRYLRVLVKLNKPCPFFSEGSMHGSPLQTPQLRSFPGIPSNRRPFAGACQPSGF
jgi:hypothetical protein